MPRMTDTELAAVAASYTGRAGPLEGVMNKTEFKGLLMEATMHAIMELASSGRLPMSICPKVHALDADELTVDRIMEEDGRESFFIKVTL